MVVAVNFDLWPMELQMILWMIVVVSVAELLMMVLRIASSGTEYKSSTSARNWNYVMMSANRYYWAERQPRTRFLLPVLLDSSY